MCTSNAWKCAAVCFAAGFVMLWAMAAIAQPPGRDIENPEKIWALQSKQAAKSIGLDAEKSAKLEEAYKAARESQQKAARAAAESAGGGRRNPGAFREVNQAERAKLEAALKAFLDAEQTSKALSTLGTFNRRWDRMVACLDGMKLEEKALTDGMNLVSGYVAESEKAMQAAAPGGNFEAIREQMGKLKEKLDTDIAKVLSAEQLTKWKEETAMRGGRGGRGMGGAGGVGGGNPPQVPAASATQK